MCTASATTPSTTPLTSPASADAPYVRALQRCRSRVRAPFCCPGHHTNAQRLPTALRQLLSGDPATHPLEVDFAELPELDSLYGSAGVLKEAQERAAQLYGAARSWFLVNGSTGGILAAMMALASRASVSNAPLLVQRNCHRSVFHGLVLTGLSPVYLAPEYDAAHDLVHGVSVSEVERALDVHADAAGVLLTSPTYHGMVCDVQAVARMCHARGVPLVVDEAHGAHLGLHPALPRSAIQLGADVVVQSTHKTLTAMTQASMLHVAAASCVDAERIAQALQLMGTTSPSALLMASLDATVGMLRDEQRREEWFERALQLAHRARQHVPVPSLRSDDPTRLTLLLPPQVDGYRLDERLIERHGVYMEMPARRHSTFIVTGANETDHVDALAEALHESLRSAEVRADVAAPETSSDTWLGAFREHRSVMTPREAYLAPHRNRPLRDAAGAVAAATVCTYPPGIPLMVPGERISLEAVAFLQQAIASGGNVTGLVADNTAVPVLSV